jgi:3beta-hydroxy-Delta5-steroid dehydrogenase / steroid Delta-isomerase
MGDSSLTPEPSAPHVRTKLGRALVTGCSGFVGANLVTELLDRGHQVRSFDRAPYLLAAHPRLEVVQGDICDPQTVAAAVEGVDTIFHTAAIIDLMGGASVTDEYRQRSFAVNVNGTKNLVHAAQVAGVKRFVYTASNSVVMGGQRLSGGDETLPYTERFNDLYTETKVVADRFVLSQNGVDGLLTCSIRPSGIWGRGDQTMFRKVFESVLAGHVKVLVGGKNVKLDNSYVHNLIHGFMLAAEHLVPGGTAPGQAYFINDGEPINMFILPACHRGVWPAMAETSSAGPAGAVRDDGMAVVSLPLRPAQAATGTPCGGTALPRQLLLDRQGAARSRIPAAVQHRAGDGGVPALLRRPLPPDEGSRCAARARLVAISHLGSSASGLISPVAL